MALFTDPPHFTGSPGHDIVGSQPLISGRVPLSSQPGVLGSQTVFAGGYLTVCADRAAAAGHPGFDLRPPRVASFTDPPDHAMTAGQDLHGSEAAISGRMPLAWENVLPDHFHLAVPLSRYRPGSRFRFLFWYTPPPANCATSHTATTLCACCPGR